MELRKIPLFHEHSISEDGMTIQNSVGRIIKQGKQVIKGKVTGYLYATMLASDYSYFKRVSVHRLVAYAWLPFPPTINHIWINHKDGNKANNHASNLEWSTISQNIQHAHDTGLRKMPRGPDHWRYGKKMSLTTRKIMGEKKKGRKHPKWKGYVIANYKRFESTIEAAQYIGVSSRTILRRCNNPNWAKEGYYFIPVSGENPI